MKTLNSISLFCTVLCTVILCSCKKPSEILTSDTAMVTHCNDYEDPTHPFIWLNLEAHKDTASYTLVLQLTLPAEAEMQNCIGKPQPLTLTSEAKPFAVRSGEREGSVIKESYLFEVFYNADGSLRAVSPIFIGPVKSAEGVMTINAWNGYDRDEVGNIDLDISVTTDSARTAHFDYHGAVTMDLFHRVRTRSQNPAFADTHFFFRNLTHCTDIPSKSISEGAHYDVVEFSTDDASRKLKLTFVMPEDSVLRAKDGEDVTFTVSDEGTPFTVRPGEMNDSAVEGSFITRSQMNDSEGVQQSIQHIIKSGTFTLKRSKNKLSAEREYWYGTTLEGVFTDEEGTTYATAYIEKPNY